MAWTAPRTWAVGELVTAAFKNIFERDNQVYLRAETCRIWVPVTSVRSGGADTFVEHYGGHSTAPLTNANDWGLTEFRVPDGFVSIIKAVIVIIPRVTQAAANYDLAAIYGGDGEARNAHVETEAAATYNVTDDQFFEVDASVVLTGIAPGDYVGIWLQLADAAHDCNVVGFYMTYNSV